MDIDSNGRVTEAEYTAYVLKIYNNVTDVDKNEFVSTSRTLLLSHSFRVMDTSFDKILTLDEVEKAIEVGFIAPPANISPLNVYRFADANVDLSLDREELVALYAKLHYEELRQRLFLRT